MHEHDLALSDEENARLLECADEMGIAPEEAAAKFIRMNALRMAGANPFSRTAKVIPLRAKKKGLEKGLPMKSPSRED
ncbi:MAG: hypothetical protein H6974_13015 [Gammaproteobacteria bacterium]|nr:hypothetical protein [Gammaproteobacteria bacterium]